MASGRWLRSPCGFVDNSIKLRHISLPFFYSTYNIVPTCQDVKSFKNFFLVRSAARELQLYYRVRLHWGRDSGIFTSVTCCLARSSGIQEHWMVSKSLGNKGIFVLDLSQLRSAPGNFFYIIEPMERGVEP